MKLAICDDEVLQQDILTTALRAYRTPAGDLIQYDIYHNGLDLLDSLHTQQYDAIFLDILMPGFTGMETAKEIRTFDQNVAIVFLTSSPEFAVESYRIHALDYLLKPIEQSVLFEVLDKIFSMNESAAAHSILVKTTKSIYVLALSQIEFLEVHNHTLQFHLIDGTTKSITGRLADYEDILLSHPEFVKVHRSYIINMDLMKVMNQKNFTTLSGLEVPISRNLIQSIQKQYIEHLHTIVRR